MEKNYLKNKLNQMEKLLSNQKSQQNKLAENYFNLLHIMVDMQNKFPDKGINITNRAFFGNAKK